MCFHQHQKTTFNVDNAQVLVKQSAFSNKAERFFYWRVKSFSGHEIPAATSRQQDSQVDKSTPSDWSVFSLYPVTSLLWFSLTALVNM